jgi:hypothetical protein
VTKVVLSGASGNIGQAPRPALLARGVDPRSAGGRRTLDPPTPGEDVCHGDLRDPAVVDRYRGQTGDERLGYRPVQNAEDRADGILKRGGPLDPIARRYQGGGFPTMDHAPTRQRPQPAGH